MESAQHRRAERRPRRFPDWSWVADLVSEHELVSMGLSCSRGLLSAARWHGHALKLPPGGCAPRAGLREGISAPLGGS